MTLIALIFSAELGGVGRLPEFAKIAVIAKIEKSRSLYR